MQKVIQIDGGIGRVLCSTGALETLAEQHEVVVITTWPDVFLHNPKIFKIYGMNREYIWDDVIRHGDFMYPEPYFKKEYYNQQCHLSQAFNTIINGIDKFHFPNIYLTPQETQWGIGFIKNIKSQFVGKTIIAFQPFGAMASNHDGIVADNTHRSLTMEAVRYIADNLKDVILVNCSHIPIDHRNVWQANFTLRELFAVVSACDHVLTIDSVLSHIGAAFQKTGILLLGSTYSSNVGYPNFTTLQREGYPKNYVPNRFTGFVDKNKDAMNFSASEYDTVLSLINERKIPLTFGEALEANRELLNNNALS